MKKSDNWLNIVAIVYFILAILFWVSWFMFKDNLSIMFGTVFIILANIEMAITTIKKYIDKTFDEKVRHSENTNVYLNGELVIQGKTKEEKI